MAEAFPLWIVGVLLVILGSIGQNLGNNLMSLGHAQQRELDAKKEFEESESKDSLFHLPLAYFLVLVYKFLLLTNSQP